MRSRILISVAGAALAVPLLVWANRPMNLSQAVDLVRSKVPGEVIAAEVDSSGDKPMHFHLDMRLPHGALVRFEVDPVSGRIASRAPAAERASGTMSLPEVLTLVSAQIPGDVTLIELDDSDAKGQHYHVDVRLSNGRLARLRVDAAGGRIAGRNGASLDP